MDVQEVSPVILLIQKVRLIPKLVIKIFLLNKYYGDSNKLDIFKFQIRLY